MFDSANLTDSDFQDEFQLMFLVNKVDTLFRYAYCASEKTFAQLVNPDSLVLPPGVTQVSQRVS
jgi:hypothetical protein